MSSLVSIIIPTLNRSHLIGGTIDSIIIQTYTNWECLVIDDGSSDYTEELMSFYVESDKRIKFFKRPLDRPKGGNAARNFGFEKSHGDCIQWFDSDDLMLANFLEKKLRSINKHNADYVVSRTKNFEDPDILKISDEYRHYYQFDKYEITHSNYAVQNINWLTPDFMGKRGLCEKVRFNENLKSAQERNFFCKITYYSCDAYIIDDYLTLRRKHIGSTRVKIKKSNRLRIKDKIEFFYETWRDLKVLNSPMADFHFQEAIKLIPQDFSQVILSMRLNWEFIRVGNIKASLFLLLYHISMKLTGKGFQLRKYFLR